MAFAPSRTERYGVTVWYPSGTGFTFFAILPVSFRGRPEARPSGSARDRDASVALGRVADDEPHERAWQHDFEVVVLAVLARHRRDDVGEQEPDPETERDPERDRAHLAREDPDRDPREDPLD